MYILKILRTPQYIWWGLSIGFFSSLSPPEKKNKTQNLNKQKTPTKQQTPKKTHQNPYFQENGKELHTHFNTSSTHINSFKSVSWSVFFSENYFAFLFVHFVLILWDIPAWRSGMITTVTKGFSFCCWHLLILILGRVTYFAGLAFKKKFWCIYMVKI